MKQNSFKDWSALNSDEANVRSRELEKGLKDIRDRTGEFDTQLYEFFARNGPEALGITKAEFLKRLVKISGRHRSWVYRLYQWILMELRLGLPHGQLKESAARILKTKVPEDAWRGVLGRVLKSKGSDHKITARDILAAAEKLNCLKQTSAKETDAGRSKRPADRDKPPVPAMVKKNRSVEPEGARPKEGDQPEASASEGKDSVGASDRVNRVLERLRGNRVLWTAVKALLSRFDKEWEVVQDVAALGTVGRSKLLKRLEELG
jgi:hypothetical protein